jgi:hypothetical protein
MVRSIPFVRSTPQRRVIALSAAAAALLWLTACERPRLSWADAAPVRTAMPSPLAHPPFTPFDSTLAADSPLAAFLVTEDRLREAGAASMLDSIARDMTESADPLTTTAPVATAPSAAASAPAGPASDTDAAMAGMDHRQHGMATTVTATVLGTADEPSDPSRCARSMRLVQAAGYGTLAVWWTRASAGRVHLMAAWRDSTPAGAAAAWRGPIPIDTLDQGAGDAQAADRGSHGCARPAPSVVWDSRTAFAHVAYAVRGPEGPGVFYAHQMDPRAAFEVPVAVLYGELLGAVRVAADGDVIAVAYEDPNTRGRTRIGLAVSRTAGHTFEAQRFVVSDDASEARDPYVTVRGRAVVTGWSDVASPSAAPPFVVRRLRVAR